MSDKIELVGALLLRDRNRGLVVVGPGARIFVVRDNEESMVKVQHADGASHILFAGTSEDAKKVVDGIAAAGLTSQTLDPEELVEDFEYGVVV